MRMLCTSLEGTCPPNAERMLDLHKRLPKASTAHEKELIQRRIDATDKEIDRLVYDLYGLTEKEIRIVEEANTHGI